MNFALRLQSNMCRNLSVVFSLRNSVPSSNPIWMSCIFHEFCFLVHHQFTLRLLWIHKYLTEMAGVPLTPLVGAKSPFSLGVLSLQYFYPVLSCWTLKCPHLRGKLIMALFFILQKMSQPTRIGNFLIKQHHLQNSNLFLRIDGPVVRFLPVFALVAYKMRFR